MWIPAIFIEVAAPPEKHVLEEAVVTCPGCWEQIELTVDPSAGSQVYVEDCSVCCQPMTVHLHVDEDTERVSVDVTGEND